MRLYFTSFTQPRTRLTLALWGEGTHDFRSLTMININGYDPAIFILMIMILLNNHDASRNSWDPAARMRCNPIGMAGNVLSGGL